MKWYHTQHRVHCTTFKLKASNCELARAQLHLRAIILSTLRCRNVYNVFIVTRRLSAITYWEICMKAKQQKMRIKNSVYKWNFRNDWENCFGIIELYWKRRINNKNVKKNIILLFMDSWKIMVNSKMLIEEQWLIGRYIIT